MIDLGNPNIMQILVISYFSIFLILQGWQDIMKLSFDFPDPFVALPDHISKNLDAWQEVIVKAIRIFYLVYLHHPIYNRIVSMALLYLYT